MEWELERRWEGTFAKRTGVSRRKEVYNQQEIRCSWSSAGDRAPVSQLPNYGNCEQRPLKYGEIMVISAYPAATVISLEQNRTFD